MNERELVALRRDLHAHPEPAFLEIRTAALVLRRLAGVCDTLLTGRAAMRADVVAGYPGQAARERAAAEAVAAGADPGAAALLAREGTAIVAELAGHRPGPVWGLRFDMDALPVAESAEPGHPPAAHGFRSANGAMHACAHDAHTAIGVALAHRLADRRFPGRVRLLFQPAEEGARGAEAMIAAGAAEGVERLVGLHLGNDLPAGVVVGGALGLLATVKLRASFHGVAAHAGSAPHLGRDALAAAAVATLRLLALPPFPGTRTRVNVGTLRAGEAANVVPAEAELTCEVRADDEDVAAELERRARAAVAGAAAMYEVGAEVRRTGRSCAMVPDDALVDAVVRAALRRCGPGRVRRHHTLSASDDVSLWAREVRGRGGLATFVLVGGGNPAPHHHPRFDVDEDAMTVAVDVLEELVRG
ncbi:amidohydrolase [Nonomuraea sp. SMC257]|uniref:Amidohydrolase n=1 Tax=Nonomuraea montanisoli TaxID=2741721 RepID=A0A7Y6IC90_9ACTN|nr:amidohydrolase [Nonomuraea montanisoli]NUW35456.1 amidohydrolase [Nonomuraea montanisoli]